MEVTMAYHLIEMDGSPNIAYERGRIVAPGIVMLKHSLGRETEVRFYLYEKEETDADGNTVVHVYSERSGVFVFHLNESKRDLTDLIGEETVMSEWVRMVLAIN